MLAPARRLSIWSLWGKPLRRWLDRILAAAGTVERVLRAALRRPDLSRTRAAALELRQTRRRGQATAGSATPPATGRPILYLAAVAWHYRFQRPQQLARSLARAGHPVLYVEAFQRTLLLPAQQLVHEEPNLQALRLRVPGRPDPYREGLGVQAAERLATVLLGDLAREARPLAILVQLPFWTELGCVLARRLQAPLVYDRIDLHTGFPGIPAAIEALETKLIRSAALVSATSRMLAEGARALGARAVEIRNAADLEAFHQIGERVLRDCRYQTALRVGYIGALGAWFDVAAVAAAAQAHPQWRFHLAGRVEDAAVQALGALPQVQLEGEISFHRVAPFLFGLDVVMIPFKDLLLTRAVDPVKLYEALAAGLPVVARRLPETERWGEPLVYLYDQPEELAPQIERAVREQTAELAERRKRAARSETWGRRAFELLDSIAAIIPPIDREDHTRH